MGDIMKWTIQQLRKIQKFPFEFEYEFDFKKDIEGINDIYDIGLVKVNGKMYSVDEDTYRLVYHIEAPLTLQCSLTLDPVNYLFNEDYDEIHSPYPSDDCFLIENSTLDLREIVWSNIIIDKPINVSLPNAHEILKERGIILDEEPKLEENEAIISFSDGKEQEDF